MANLVSKIKSTSTGTIYEVYDENAQSRINDISDTIENLYNNIPQTKQLPKDCKDYVGRIFQFTDEGEYENGYFYKCIESKSIEYKCNSITPINYTPQDATFSFDKFNLTYFVDTCGWKLNPEESLKIVISNDTDKTLVYVNIINDSASTELSQIWNSEVENKYDVAKSILRDIGLDLQTTATEFEELHVAFDITEGDTQYFWQNINVQPVPEVTCPYETYSISLPKLNWSNKTQVVSVEGILVSDNIVSCYPVGVYSKEFCNFHNSWGVIPVIENSGSVTFNVEIDPDIDLTVNLTVKKK